MKPVLSLPTFLRMVLFMAWFGARLASAQILVGPAGVTNTFDTLPPASAWSGSSTPGSSTDVNDAAGVDAQAVTNVVVTITNELITAFGNPPAANSPGPVWASTGYIQTRPAGVRFMLLMARLQNDAGLPLASLGISYDYTFINHYFTDGSLEQVPGHRVFYSLTGEALDWQLIPGLSGHTNSGRLSAVLNLGSWPTNAPLYLLWVDDNSATDVDYPLQIDNFTAWPRQLAPIITNQPLSQSIGVGGSITFQVGASGPGTLTYQWRKDGVAIPGATGTNFTIASAQLSDVALYSVQVSSIYGSVVSENAVLIVTCFGNPAFTAQPQSQFLPAGGTISLSVTVSGTPPYRYQWYHNGALLPGATNATYVKAGVTVADVGYYQVAVSACGHTVVSAAALVAIGKSPFSLIGLTNQLWRYDQSGTDPGTFWREPGFNDSAWLLGRGVLGFDSHPVVAALTNTVLARTNFSGSITSHYFRIHFTLTNDPREVLLVASNLVDDGCIVYLNGHEAYRINMPGGPVTATTLASQSAVEGLFLAANLSSSFLVPGDNVLAAEVHQLNAAHDDVVFGLSLTATFPPPAPLAITSQPLNLTLEETRPASFTVGVQGQPAFFQWFRNGVPAPVSTSQPFIIPSVSTNDSGNYWVVVTNVFNSVTSAPFTLTVLRDMRGPVLLEADGGVTPTNVLVTFSEAVSIPTATNLANYRITNTLGGTLTVTSAVLQNGSNVLLTTSSPRLVDFNYLLTVSNVRDASPQSNVIVLNSQRPVRRSVSLVNFDSTWRYLDPYPGIDEANLGTSWKEFTYDEGFNFWGDGFGVFWALPDPGELPGSTGTALSQSPALISYFRSGFNLPASPGGLRLAPTHIIDDGGILYLNGQELLRVNMSSGPVNYQTPALSAVGTIARVGPLQFEGALPVRSGSNVLAFELHQTMPDEENKVFGLQLEASVQSYVTGAVFITGGPEDVTVMEGTTATFSVVQAGGATFGWQQNSNAIPGATNAVYVIPSVPLSLNGARFRAFVSNSTSFMVTTNALLQVIPDTTPPVLLSALGSPEGAILLTFNEPLDATSAGTIANYLVTNSLGQSLTVSSATLTNGTNVLLTFAMPPVGAVSVVVNSVRDTAVAQNAVAPNSSVPLGADYFIPMTSAWKYLLTNTNTVIQASFMQSGYDDSTWAGPSNALLYVENAVLPAPKNTPLVLFDPSGNRINTFYFRRKFFAPFAASSVTMILRYIIDDGMVLHLNGHEIYRFNMPAGPITAGTVAASTIGDATLVGPINIPVSNLIAGTNVFAVEVHQTGTADIVMGVEISVHIPGVIPPIIVNPLPLQPSRPYLEMLRLGQSQVLYWTEPAYTLESANDVTGPWVPSPGTAPHLLSPTNAAAFYRLRQ